jgi:hypothetical protein
MYIVIDLILLSSYFLHLTSLEKYDKFSNKDLWTFTLNVSI